MSDDEAVKVPTDGDEEQIEVATDLSNSDVCTKYQEASKIVNLALQGIVAQCLPGASIIDISEFGRTVIVSQSAKLFTKKVAGQVVDRGVAFPVCISVNDIVCNHAPLESSEERAPLKAGDIVKIDLGCHIDGYIAVAAHTCIVPESADAPPTLPNEATGNVAVAAYNAMLVAASAIAAGKKNTEVTEAVDRVAKAYGVVPISSVRMHQMKRYVLDGVKEVALKEPAADEADMEEKVPDCTFEQFEVYAVDVALSTGDGNARPGSLKTTIFKRNVEQTYQLKVKASRALLAEVDKKFPTLPFSLRHLDDVRQARLGIPECVSHGLLTPYPSLHDHSGVVAHFKCTVLLLPSGTVRVTGLDLPDYFKTATEADEETQKVLKALEEEETKKAARKAAKKNKKKAGK